jgi:hypothetical protein
MKLTNKILTGMLVLFGLSIIISAFKFKQEYDKNDKGELYFLYGTIEEQPFHHLVINGGNLTRVVYEPADKSSVRVFKRWNGYHDHRLKTEVRNDTLYLDIPNRYNDIYEKMQLSGTNIIRLFSPELKSVTGTNTNLKLTKLKQKNIIVDISGNSSFVAESLIYDLNALNLKASDTTNIVFEIAASLKKTTTEGTDGLPAVIKGWDAFHISRLQASASGHSFIDIGHAQVDSIDFHLSDTSAILLSGGTIRKNRLAGQ